MADTKKIGCIAGLGCGAMMLLGAGFMVAIFMFVMGAIKSSDVFATTMDRARTHPQVTAVTGTPVSDRWYLMGNMQTSGASGNANISIPVVGPGGEGTVHVVATKSAGEWTYQSMVFESGANRVDMLQ